MTRAQIDILDKDQILVRLYVHSDGYPQGIMNTICKKYCDYKEVNGIPLDAQKVYNGIKDFAPQLIHFLKKYNEDGTQDAINKLEKATGYKSHINSEAGWLYVESSTSDIEVDFRYNIYSQDEKLYVSCVGPKDTVFEGTMNEYLEWIDRKEE